MPPNAKGRRLRALATVGILVPVIAVVVYTSFDVNQYACDVCMVFEGREVCRTVEGATREDAHRSSIDNACAQLASGVTDTMRCSRTEPKTLKCRKLSE